MINTWKGSKTFKIFGYFENFDIYHNEISKQGYYFVGNGQFSVGFLGS